MKLKLQLITSIIILLFAACNKDEDITFDPNAKLNFSTDSVLFDTVFTSVGSTSRRLKIFNKNSKAINIDFIKLSGGSLSAFNININGKAASEVNNLKINGNDSINVFVKVNINPTAQDLPFLVEDSILMFFNGKKEKIPLVAYGQNAIFINNENIKSNTVWTGKLPYIIYNGVTIAEKANLTINHGTKVLFHGKASMSIKGTLTVNGTKKDSVVFASDRLERIYEEESGQWNGLHFYGSSKNSTINFAIIKNAIAGITVDSLSVNANPKLVLSNSIIKNMEVVGFLGYHTELAAFNNLFFNCGQYLIYGIGGGSYNLKQNTFGAYNYNFPRKTPSVYLSDYISDKEFYSLKAEILNNIIWGSLDEEFVIEKKTSLPIIADVKNNLIKTKSLTYNGNGNILNADPLFINPRFGIFTLAANSPALNKGLNLSTDFYFNSFLNKDLKNKERLFASELGCYENN